MTDKKTIEEYIRALEHITGFLQSLLDEENKQPKAPKHEREKLSELTELRILAKSDQWPEAVPEELLCGEDDEHKNARAAGIIHDFVKENIKDKSFLDFGCGDGNVAWYAANLADTNTTVGYDLIEQNWERFLPKYNLSFTTDWGKVHDMGPYDIVVVNDVLDHADNPKEVMEKIASVKTPGTGKVFMRCHPWASRHGTHVYKQLNKAFLHLVFNEQEMATLGLTEMKTNKLLNPQNTYRRLIKEAGLSILQENITTQPVEMFFSHHPAILRRIREKWRNVKFPRETMEIQFVEYVLV